MPTAKTQRIPPTRGKPARRQRRKLNPRESAPAVVPHGRVSMEDGAVYVMLSEDEYERIMDALEHQELVARLKDPDTKWIDFDEYRLQLAGSKIAEARKARKLTQVQLARKLGVPQSQISRIERHPDQTTVRTLKRIAKALRVDVSLLVE